MSKLQKIYYSVIATASTFPLAVAAQSGGSVDNLLNKVLNTLRTVVGVLFVIATIVFLWGVIQFIASSGNEEGRKKAKGIMTWGIIGLAVMAAAWGVAGILVQYFEVGGGGITPNPIPTIR